MIIADYTLCYVVEDGKFHIGRGCSEKEERFIGKITEDIAPVGGYRGIGNRLVISDLEFITSSDIALSVPQETEIVLEGNASITIKSDKDDANVSVLYSFGDVTIDAVNQGRLNVCADTAKGLWSRGICARGGNLTIKYGQFNVVCGNAEKSCCLYAGGHLFINTGEKGRIDILGGDLTLASKSNAVRASEGRLRLSDGAIVENAKECQKGSWSGGALTQSDFTAPMRIYFG